VKSAHGVTLIDNTTPTIRRVLDADVAACTVDLLRGGVRSGTGTAAMIPGVDVAGKTGTTEEKSDAWFVGMTHDLVAAVWMGAPEGRVPMRNVGGIEVFGGTYPARIWQRFVASQVASHRPPDLPAPGPVCDRPGLFVSDNGRGARPTPEPAPDDAGGPPPPSTPSTTRPRTTTTTRPPTTTTVPTTTTTVPTTTTTTIAG
jgi:penicillin-binding protein 1A